MIFRKLYILILIISFTNCKVERGNQSLSGTYSSETYNSLEKTILGLRNINYVLHSKLLLNSDSNYIMNTCGNEIEGIWKVKKDTLYLICLKNKYFNDSINNIRHPSCGEKPTLFYISNNSNIKLINEFNNNGRRIYNNLVKNE